MTLAQIRTMVTSHTTDFQLDNYVSAAPTDAELTAQVNWAIRLFSKRTFCNFDPEITFTLTADTALYDCRDVSAPAVVSRKVLLPLFVTINGTVLRDFSGRAPGLWSFNQLLRTNPMYQTEDSGRPTRAVWLPGNKMLLSAPPDAGVVSDGDNYIAGAYLAADMANGTDDSNSPDIPEEYHEILAYLAAVKAGMPRATEESAWRAISTYDAEAWREISAMAEDNHNRLMGKTTGRGADNEWMSEACW
jgi:hypothetical protein